jgi:hypothetical protein
MVILNEKKLAAGILSFPGVTPASNSSSSSLLPLSNRLKRLNLICDAVTPVRISKIAD